MSISAASTSKDRVFRGGAQARQIFTSLLPFLSSSISFQQGDLLCYDTSAHTIRVVAATTDAPQFLGVSPVKISSGKLAGPYDGLTAVDAAQQPQDAGGPQDMAEFHMKLNTGDSFVPGCKVYLVDGGDSQTVSVTNPDNTGDTDYNLGVYTGPAVTGALQDGPCWLKARWPIGVSG